MSDRPVRLVTKAEETLDDVERMLRSAADEVKPRGLVAGAVVLIDAAGIPVVAQIARGNRTLLLGAVTDLMFSLSAAGSAIEGTEQ